MYIINWTEFPGRTAEYIADNWEDAQHKLFRLACQGYTASIRCA